jgi:hypothetical protein
LTANGWPFCITGDDSVMFSSTRDIGENVDMDIDAELAEPRECFLLCDLEGEARYMEDCGGTSEGVSCMLSEWDRD